MSIFSEVTASEDFHRIKDLPAREVDPNAYVIPVTEALRSGSRAGFPLSLLPIQAWALYEIARVGGLLGPIGVGHGKTGLDILAPLVVPGCRVACLLIPASLKEQIYRNYEEWRVNFKVPNLIGTGTHDPKLPTVYIVTYESLSREKCVNYLNVLQPDLIIADEAHHLRRKGATRTRRVLRYFADHPNTRFCAWSGTLTSNSIKDYAHLSALALRKGSPLPINWAVVEEWCEVLDANPRGQGTKLAGALEYFGEDPRAGFQQRLKSTIGVVATSEDSVKCSLYMVQRPIQVPFEVEVHLDKLRLDWERPDGEKFVEASQVYRCGRELSSGFYYKWEFPRGESKEQIDAWKEVRKNWHMELREELAKNKPYMDSPLLCARAARRHLEGYAGELPTWDSVYFKEWMEIKGTVRPVTVPVWISDFLIKDLLKVEKGIIWYEHDTFGKALKAAGLPVYGAGENGIVDETGDLTVAASLLAHGTGKNLQQFSNQVFGNYPTKLAAWEQIIGRSHRQGQKADEVIIQLYRHTPEMCESFKKARGYALYVQETLGVKQKLLTASYTFNPEE